MSQLSHEAACTKYSGMQQKAKNTKLHHKVFTKTLLLHDAANKQKEHSQLDSVVKYLITVYVVDIPIM